MSTRPDGHVTNKEPKWKKKKEKKKDKSKQLL